MATLNPTLSTSIPFERPAAAVQRPNVGGQLLGLGADILGNVFEARDINRQLSQPDAPRDLTADERFAQDWAHWQNLEGSRIDPNNPNFNQNFRDSVAQFIRINPQHTGQALELARGFGIENLSNPAVQIEQAQMSAEQDYFANDPRGQLDYAAALAASIDENGELDMAVFTAERSSRYTRELQIQRELEDMERNGLFRDHLSKASAQTWELFKTALEDYVITTNQAVADIVEQMRVNPSGSIPIPPEMAQQLGLDPNTVTAINANNLPIVLTQIRGAMQKSLRDQVVAAQPEGVELEAPDQEYWNEVFYTFDQIVSAASDFDSLPSTLSAMTSRDQIDAMNILRREARDISMAIALANQMPDAVATPLFAQLNEIISPSRIQELLTLGMSDSDPTVIRQFVEDQSRSDSQDSAEFGWSVLSQPLTNVPDTQIVTGWNTAFGGLYNGQSEEAFVNAEVFTNSVILNWQPLMDIANQSESFKRQIQEDLTRDLLNTYAQVQNLDTRSPVVSSINEYGEVKFSLDPIALQSYRDVEQATFEAEIVRLNSSPDVVRWNNKIMNLRGVGSEGLEIANAVLMNIPEYAQAQQPQEGGGSMTSQSAATPQPQEPSGPPGLLNYISSTESGGSYDTLFGFSQREGGRFAGVDITSMTIGQVLDFQSPRGEYGQWVKDQVGRVATPVGMYQIVGTTLRRVAKELGLSEDTVFTPEVQDRMFFHLVDQALSGKSSMSAKMSALRGTWEGFKSVSDADLSAAITEYENGNPGAIQGGMAGRPTRGGNVTLQSAREPDPAPEGRPTRREQESVTQAPQATQASTPRQSPSAQLTEASVQEMATRMAERVIRERDTGGKMSQKEKDALIAEISQDLLEALGVTDS